MHYYAYAYITTKMPVINLRHKVIVTSLFQKLGTFGPNFLHI